MYKVNEIFKSLQGEGYNTGKEVVFIRLFGCNLHCVWCDTNQVGFIDMCIDKILYTVNSHHVDNVIITGGEPTIHEGVIPLIQELKKKGYWVGIETNGIHNDKSSRWIENNIDYIATSPKANVWNNYTHIKKADEVRIVVDKNTTEEICNRIRRRIQAHHYYLSPCEKDGKFNMLDTITLLGKLNEKEGSKWKLSIQTHKLAKIA